MICGRAARVRLSAEEGVAQTLAGCGERCGLRMQAYRSCARHSRSNGQSLFRFSNFGL